MPPRVRFPCGQHDSCLGTETTGEGVGKSIVLTQFQTQFSSIFQHFTLNTQTGERGAFGRVPHHQGQKWRPPRFSLLLSAKATEPGSHTAGYSDLTRMRLKLPSGVCFQAQVHCALSQDEIPTSFPFQTWQGQAEV